MGRQKSENGNQLNKWYRACSGARWLWLSGRWLFRRWLSSGVGRRSVKSLKYIELSPNGHTSMLARRPGSLSESHCTCLSRRRGRGRRYATSVLAYARQTRIGVACTFFAVSRQICFVKSRVGALWTLVPQLPLAGGVKSVDVRCQRILPQMICSVKIEMKETNFSSCISW